MLKKTTQPNSARPDQPGQEWARPDPYGHSDDDFKGTLAMGNGSGLETRDTADWKSAVPTVLGIANVPQVSNLLYRRLPVGQAVNVRGDCALQYCHGF